MASSIRPWVTAGVAVSSVAVLAVAPLEPTSTFTDVRITNSAVDLTAAPNPLEFYPQVLMRSLANAGDRLDEFLDAPLPIVRAVAENQYNSLAEVVSAIGTGDVVAVVRAVVRAIADPVINLARVAGSGEPFRTAASVIIRLALPIASGVIAAGSAAGDVAEALLHLAVVGTLGAVTNIPGRIADGFLNGRVDETEDSSYGLLSPVVEAPVVDQLTGPVAHLVDSLQAVGETLSAPAGTGSGSVGMGTGSAGTATGPAEPPDPGAVTVPLPRPETPAATTLAPQPPRASAPNDPAPAEDNPPTEESENPSETVENPDDDVTEADPSTADPGTGNAGGHAGPAEPGTTATPPEEPADDAHAGGTGESADDSGPSGTADAG
ncbi:hypothetical protein ACTWP6_20210 [Mycobacterium sp. 4D054]|uniref:hypothetical protein n=1 Tax=Mycobacterium sp. 4D054 TaxID=3457440 RepID=UPI003FD15104